MNIPRKWLNRNQAFLLAKSILVIFTAALCSAQELTSPAKGVWNGFNRHINVVECSNVTSSPISLRIILRNNLGQVLGVRNLNLAGYGSNHTILNDFPIQNSYGIYDIEQTSSSDGRADFLCTTVIYRLTAPNSPKALEYAFSLPVVEPLLGETSGLFNSLNPEIGGLPVLNWLTVYNPGSSLFSASVFIHRQDGALDPAASFFISNLQPGERRDFQLGGQSNGVVGSYRIVPEDPQTPYGAFLSRYNLSRSGAFRYAFPLLSEKGSCNANPVPASTMDPAINWAELLNPTSDPISLEIEIRNAAGLVKNIERINLAPFAQHHVYLNQYLGERQVGSFVVRCLNDISAELKPIVQSIYYGRRNVTASTIDWAYASQAKEFVADANSAIATSVNTFLNSANWNKYFDAGSSSFATSVSLYNGLGNGVGRRTYSVLPNGSIDIGLHETLGPNQVGLALASTASSSAQFSSDTLRVYPDSRGGIGYIMNIHGRVIARSPSLQGPVQVSSNGHGFEFRAAPVMLVGDSVTQGWMELGTAFDQESYLDALSARGINAFMIWAFIGINNQVQDSRIGFNAPRLWPWVETTGNVVPPYNFQFVDGSSLPIFNENYFSRLRSLIDAANKRNIVVLITVHDGWTKQRFLGHPFNSLNGGPLSVNTEFVQLANYTQEMPTVFNPAWSRFEKHQFYLERFCDRLIQATADYPNVMYEMFNEGEWYNQSKLRSFQLHFLQFFKARTERPLIFNKSGSADLREEPETDVISYHSPNWSSQTQALDSYRFYSSAWYELDPPKPIIFSEPVPEYTGGEANRTGLMRLMWGTLIAGSSYLVQNDTRWIWQPSNVDPIFDLTGHAARFFNQNGPRFWLMRPVEELCSTGICLVNPGNEYVVYSQSGQSLTVDLFGRNGNFLVRFYNPRTGTFHSQTLEVTGGDNVTIAKPSSADWVIWLLKQ